ncbi:ATP synthase F1 subunit gamma [Staphylococcus carnosus]|uniref:ATP synthase gamma chain n=1 Tax=Staphylococcus carnosus (strain TM300) TaxID=396513 RepID=ATPG_STACT|nr:ATP synthase F1 subunit gamma [Staphylococcus carnosus]B9DME4.1 RecName: Full=ATP synthase gamma chain; AltName: Full=ATP synthase F1 sector gamma subunit; AltName: Full=F-ATPase gamma subunit [Staphylococcus carnosus subsp. carnosus TM300]QPT04608.1 F0F1 ATP synthase subunit gamma [Staphylococcus carnosus]UQA67333.1 F0F1 ATP synthase subunit gamma [Staphylococcus carnosus]UTB77833.1 F0F1 ATP synthase subunit gamma [Staphylococcus carnosus]UTB87378.1 F0F1 ATP synthase subunit gamma [Staphyl
MGSLKDIDSRIKSTKKMNQITKAMNMVASSKLNKAQRNSNQFKPYMDKLQNAITAVAGQTTSNHPMLVERPVKKRGYLVISSDRGLAGAYNANILRKVLQDIQERGENPSDYKLLVLGKVGIDFFKNRSIEVEYALPDVPDQPTFKSIEPVTKKAIDLYENGDIDELNIYYNKFINVLESKPTAKRVLPLSKEDASSGLGQMSSYEFEPDKESILNIILPQYVEGLIYGTILNAKASEHAMRMTAMKNASDNASDLIDDLSLQYNRARQAAITQQITEIVGGATALE